MPVYLLGAPIEDAYPVVPLTGGHGISIGMTSVGDRACFGVYAQTELAEVRESVVICDEPPGRHRKIKRHRRLRTTFVAAVGRDARTTRYVSHASKRPRPKHEKIPS